MTELNAFDRMKHALECIALDAGTECDIRGQRQLFDLAMCRELALFGLGGLPDGVQIVERIEREHAARITAWLDPHVEGDRPAE